MLHSKVLQLFQVLDASSKKQLQQLVRTPHGCPNTAVAAFWQYFLSKKYLSAHNTQPQKVFTACFPEAAYNNAKLRRLASVALSFLENNVRYFEKKKAPLDRQIKQLAFYRKHDLNIFVQALFKNSRKDLADLPYRDEQYYLQQYLLDVEKFEWEGQDQRLKGNNLQQLTQSLSHFYSIATLKYACVGLTHQNLRQAEYDLPLLQAILTQIETKPAPLAVQVYYHAFLALQDTEDTMHFQALKKILLEQPIQSIFQEPKEILLLAINCCIKRINSGQTRYIRETFELYLLGLEEAILVEPGAYLSRHAFKNIMALALRLKEFDWAKNFIAAAPKWLEAPYLQAQVDYNTAKLYVSQQQFEPAMRLLQQVDFDDIFMNMDAKVMLLKMYYSTQNMEALDALLNSFDVFLHRKKNLSYHRDNYQNIVRLIRKLVNMPTFNAKGKQQLRALIIDTQPLTEKAWLLEQLD